MHNITDHSGPSRAATLSMYLANGSRFSTYRSRLKRLKIDSFIKKRRRNETSYVVFRSLSNLIEPIYIWKSCFSPHLAKDHGQHITSTRQKPTFHRCPLTIASSLTY